MSLEPGVDAAQSELIIENDHLLADTAVVMVTVDHRVAMLNRFLTSLVRRYPAPNTPKVLIHVQGDYSRWLEGFRPPPSSTPVPFDIMHTPDLMGCHGARVALLNHFDLRPYAAFVNVDDDVVLIDKTDWGTAIARAQTSEENGTGFVLTNWVRSAMSLSSALVRIEPVFKRQIMVYQGGGMAYSPALARLMASELKPEHARYDDLWPLTAYLHGYRSYRYLGSLAVHQIMSKGGMRSYMSAAHRPLLGWDWIDYTHLQGAKVGRDYAIPLDHNLRPEAHAAHKKARQERGWKI